MNVAAQTEVMACRAVQKGRNTDRRVFLKIGSYAGTVGQNIDAERLNPFARTDTSAHQKAWAVQGARAEDDFVRMEFCRTIWRFYGDADNARRCAWFGD